MNGSMREFVGSAGIQPQQNAVVVGVTTIADDVTAEVARRAGVDIDRLQFALFARDDPDDAPLGGHAISRVLAPNNFCSTGAHGYVWYLGLQVPFLVTAAHCFQYLRHDYLGIPGLTSHDPTFVRGPYILGGSGGSTHWAPGDAQAMYHGTGDDVSWQPTSLVEGWAPLNYDKLRLIGFGAPGLAGDRVGDLVCQAGARTGGSAGNCATIIARNEVCYGNEPNHYNVYDMRRIRYLSAPGDSGGTVYEFSFSMDVRLLGFHQGTCNSLGGDKIYTWHFNARVGLGLDGWFLG